MTFTATERDQPDRQSIVAVVDAQRLRRDALASALALRGLTTVSSAKPPSDAALLLLQEDAADRQAMPAGSPPYLLIASSGAHTSINRDGRSQALAVVPTGATVDDLVSAVAAALAGSLPVFALVETATGDDHDVTRRVRSLSPRERAILVELASGQQNQEIGSRLGISSNTVRTHVQNIFGKLDVDNRGAAVAAARRAGLRLERGCAGDGTGDGAG
jgi:DNA-binding CsgD family transcriptional regulator